MPVNLTIYQKCYDFYLYIQAPLRQLPKHEKYALAEQVVNFLSDSDSCDVLWFDSYTYNVSDSAFYLIELGRNGWPLLIRYVEPANFADITPETGYINYTKKQNQKLKNKGYKYANWGRYKIKQLNKADMDVAQEMYKEYKAAVKALNDDGKDWYMNKKKLTKKEKNSTAWRLVTGKSNISEIEKK